MRSARAGRWPTRPERVEYGLGGWIALALSVALLSLSAPSTAAAAGGWSAPLAAAVAPTPQLRLVLLVVLVPLALRWPRVAWDAGIGAVAATAAWLVIGSAVGWGLVWASAAFVVAAAGADRRPIPGPHPRAWQRPARLDRP